MSIRRVVPNITSDRPAETVEFFVTLLEFEVAMDLGWVATLAARANPTAQLTILRREPGAPGGTPGGDPALQPPQVSIEVDDVDAVHATAVERGFDVAYPVTDEPWGVRRFFVTDPNGVVVNVLAHAGERDRAG